MGICKALCSGAHHALLYNTAQHHNTAELRMSVSWAPYKYIDLGLVYLSTGNVTLQHSKHCAYVSLAT